MRRTQLYLDDDLWKALHARARSEQTTISDLVRQAIRERYLGSLTARKAAMQAVVGIWKDRSEIGDTKAYIRGLRRGTRLKRLTDK
jgi:hypothetical protein